jgi:hypothetical protein
MLRKDNYFRRAPHLDSAAEGGLAARSDDFEMPEFSSRWLFGRGLSQLQYPGTARSACLRLTGQEEPAVALREAVPERNA